MPLQQNNLNQFNQPWNLTPQPTPSPSLNQFQPQQQIQSQPEFGQSNFAIDDKLEQYINNTIKGIL